MDNKYNVMIRLCDELRAILCKVEVLDEFIRSEKYLDLSKRHQDLLEDQFSIMQDYIQVLGSRIDDLT